MQYATVKTKINDLDRTVALVRALYGDKPTKGSYTPYWMTLTITAEFMLDLGGSAEAVVASYLQRVLLDSEMTFIEFFAFCESLHCEGATVNKIVQLTTILGVSDNPFETIVRFINQSNPIEIAHVYVAHLHTQYARYVRHNTHVKEEELTKTEKGLVFLIEHIDNELLRELASYVGEQIEYIRNWPKALTKKEI